jgi:hypothetical protein
MEMNLSKTQSPCDPVRFPGLFRVWSGICNLRKFYQQGLDENFFNRVFNPGSKKRGPFRIIVLIS